MYRYIYICTYIHVLPFLRELVSVLILPIPNFDCILLFFARNVEKADLYNQTIGNRKTFLNFMVKP